ncbi:putative transposase [Burkholderia sola]|nr:putative transposase [Burkholderia cenocepacia]CAG2324509.1 putative transposase [Burkholderia cenocepacia]CAG2324547.1 putative transposase [Burkholderia cenocepacia]CAG2324561.1 putative transposase [Burkholderia cenocepacia]CAG2324607.1 putative transposase [Burkholderia cenocepacia]
MVRGLEKVEQLLPLPMATYNLTLLRSLAALPRTSRSIDCRQPTGI